MSSIHDPEDHEDYCVITTNSTINRDQFIAFLSDTLYGNEDFELSDWDQAPNETNHIFFVPGGCNYETLITVKVQDSTSAACGGTNFSCVDQNDATDPPVCDTHCHHAKPVVYLKTSHVSGMGDPARHVVNHEFGHVLGLDDPNYNLSADHSWTACQVLNEQGEPEWIDSIMHAPNSYCDGDFGPNVGQFRAWPTQLDRWGVGAQIQQP